MPKQKTKKAITRRFRVTKSGKVIRRQGFVRHLNTKKSSKKKRALRRPKLVDKTHARKIKKFMGV